ncbi:MAG: DUF4382 domain-containing protein [Candidatus Nanohalobium sp.]
MKKLLISAVLVLAFTVPAASAQQQNSTNVKANPGIVGPGSMFYGAELAMDDFSMSIGLTTAQKVAAERASEALAAAGQNNTEAANQALKNLNKLAKKHNITEKDGTSKALQILGKVKEKVPEEAMQGIQTAMNNIQKNVPAQIPAGPMSGKSDKKPAVGPGSGNKTPGTGKMPNGTGDRAPETGNMTGGKGDTQAPTNTTTGGDRTVTDDGSTTQQTSAPSGRFYLMVSDRPADISDFDYLNVTFSKAKIFQKNTDSTGNTEDNTTSNETTNQTVNGTEMNSTETNSTETNTTEKETTEEKGFRTVELNGTADLTQVVGDKAKSIAKLNLEEGNYTKISLYAADIEASVNGSEVNVKIPPGKLMITKPFTVTSNSTTGFVFDIGVFLRGNQQNNQGYILKPVISESGVAGKEIPVNLTNRKSMGQIPDFAGKGKPGNKTSGGQPDNRTSGQQGQPGNQTAGRP